MDFCDFKQSINPFNITQVKQIPEGKKQEINACDASDYALK